jgi:hypothetical protein
MSNEVLEVYEVSEVLEVVGVVELNERIESLLARVHALEARLNDLCPPPKSSTVRPEGVPPFDVKRRIEALESKKEEDNDEDEYYKNWDSPSIQRYSSFVVNDGYVSKESGIAMFTRIYYIIPKMISLDMLTMISNNGSGFDSSLTVLPDLRKIKNVTLRKMRICIGFDFIPYLDNFPCLTRLEIVDHPIRTALNLDLEKKRKIREYCEKWDIELLMSGDDEVEYTHWVTNNAHTFVKGRKNLVACIFCSKIYETDVLLFCNRSLVCPLCESTEVLMVVNSSPLLEMSDVDRMKKLTEWRAEAFP